MKLALPAAIACAGACGTVPRALDDLKSVHIVTNQTIEHRFEVERFGWIDAIRKWGFLSNIPGLSGEGVRTAETLDDPADFCVSNVKKLRNINFTDISETAEAVFWVGAVVEADPFPLSRIEGLRVLESVIYTFQPSMQILNASDIDYVQNATRMTLRIIALLDISRAGALTPELREEYIKTIGNLGSTPFARASESRAIGQTLGLQSLAETDPEIRRALTVNAAVLVSRGALQQLDRALGDTHEQVRIAAARSLVGALGATALPRIIEKLKGDSVTEVRVALASIAGFAARMGREETEPVIDYLATASADPEPAVSVNAMESLGRLTGVGRNYDADWWRQWYKQRLEKPRVRQTEPAQATSSN